MGNDYDAMVNRYILTQYRSRYDTILTWSGRGQTQDHLAKCPDTEVADPNAEDGYYGCETGCEYVLFEATLKCPHGFTDQFGYGEFGQLAYIIADMEREENDNA